MEVSDLLWVIIPLFVFLDTTPAMFISVIVLIFVMAQDPDNKDIVDKITTPIEKDLGKIDKPQTVDPKEEPVTVTPVKEDSTAWN